MLRSVYNESHPISPLPPPPRVDLATGQITPGSWHDGDGFSFNIDKLSVKREINRNVDLNEMTHMSFVTEGSNSHIFSAVWNNRNVIIKVRHLPI
jgi:hypothetical protein